MIANIGVVDDHPAALRGISNAINAQLDLRVTAAAATVRSLLDIRSTFDLVLLDLQLADGSTPATNVGALRPTGAAVLIFTSGENPALVRQAARGGVVGMIRKSESLTTILDAIRKVLAGESVVSADWASALGADREFVDAHLTGREAEVLACYATGLTAEQVASTLFVSRETIVDHLRRIRGKYATVGRDAPTKIDLHRRAIEDGLVTPPSSSPKAG